MEQACCIAEVDLAAHVTRAVRIVQGRPADMVRGPLFSHGTHNNVVHYTCVDMHGIR